MKTLCGLLIVVVTAHLHCGDSCLVESFSASTQTASTSTEPPCHKHAEIPSKEQQPSHESKGPCSEGSVLRGKISIDGKIALELIAVLPTQVATVLTSSSAVPGFIPENPPGASPYIVSTSILRI
jgi:hypothetical protein